jgi:two-component system response regulator VicR
MTMRILIVDDDVALARVLRDNLVVEGFEVSCVTDGDRAITSIREHAVDLVVLDVMLPGRDGFALCEVLSQCGRTPIIFLTARGHRADKLKGLKLGADDYMTKPFDLEEFLARVHAVIRRAWPTVGHVALGSVTIDFRSQTAVRGDTPLHLTHQEFMVLKYLAERHDKVVDRDELLRVFWGYPDAPETRCVDHAITRLRKKIEPDFHSPRYLHTSYAGGYVLTPDGAADRVVRRRPADPR